jgi:predicted HTH transcriptional regulator
VGLLKMIEAWGTGIPKIFEEARNYGLREPELQDMGSDFRINLYRKELAVDGYGVIAPDIAAEVGEICEEGMGEVKGDKRSMNGTKVDSDDKKLLSVIRKDGTVTQLQMKQGYKKRRYCTLLFYGSVFLFYKI